MNMSLVQLHVWDPGDCRRIHQATLELLEDPGVEVRFGPARDVLSDLGARVSGCRVRIGADLVEGALASAPRRWAVKDRSSKRVVFLAQGNTYFGTGSDCLYLTDPETGARRRVLTRDIEVVAALCERLEEIDFVMSMGLPADVPQSVDDIAQVAAMLKGTRKPLLVAPRNGAVLKLMRDMVALCGGAESLMVYAMPSPPLMHDEDALSKILVCADLGLPLVYAPAPAAGGTAPAALAATIVVGNAEILSGLVLHQAVRPGAPFVYGAGCGILDLRTALDVYAAPEHFLGNHAACELAEFYGLPSFAYAGVSDSKAFDEQLSAEYALTVLLGALSRATLLHDVGYMESGLRSSHETIVFGNELVGFARAFMRGCSVDDDALALAEIIAVGPGRHHLSRKHTRTHHRGFWRPTLLDHQHHDRWLADGATTLFERTRLRSQQIAASPREFELPPDVTRELDGLLASAASAR